MLVANPHFPWEGELRFWEVHLTVPGVADAYGVQLSGVPGIGIGFTSEFGWTHTVSAGNRLTAYSLDLVPSDPTSYVYGDETRQMTSKDLEIEVLGDDGDLETVTHTSWSSHYGPILDFPGFGWTADATITYRDANIDDDEFIDQYFGMLEAKDFDGSSRCTPRRTASRCSTPSPPRPTAGPGTDTSATPDLSDGAIAAYGAALRGDRPGHPGGSPERRGAARRVRPHLRWVEEDDTTRPGRRPAPGGSEVVFNANDSFWMPHATELLEGDYSPLHGRQGTARSPRTRENASVLSDTSADGPSGEDGTFDLDELADAALLNEGFTARALRAEVVDRCEGVDEVTVPEVPVGEDGNPGLPGGTVDISAACDVLATWDGIYDLDSAGAPLWRELLSRFSSSDLTEAGDLWAEPFDPADPLGTPSGLAPAGDGERADLVLERLAYAVQALDAAGFAPDVPLGEAQFALRDGERIPIHGGNAFDGTTNVVGFGSGASIRDPKLLEQDRERLVGGSQLSTLDGETGYPVNNGTSFLMALAFTDDGPQAKVFLTYSNTEDRSADDYTEATRRFSEKDWRPVAFTEEDVAADTRSTITVRG
ncbi:MAG: penicillin acylase family protein [Acidimicrobiales bacterium]